MSDQSDNKTPSTTRAHWQSPIIPKYYQVELALKQRIADLDPGTSLPSEPELAREYGVSRATLRTAINELENLGLLCRIQGRGTFVGTTTMTIPLGYHSRNDAHPEPDEVFPHKLISHEIALAGETWSKEFSIDQDDEVLVVDRISVANGLAMSFDTLVVPLKRVPSLTGADFESGRFFYTLLDFGVPISQHRITIESVIIDGELAGILEARPGLPGICLTRLGLDNQGVVLAHVRIVTRGDLGRYVIEFPSAERRESEHGTRVEDDLVPHEEDIS